MTVDDVDDITDSEEGEDTNTHSHSFLPLPRREPTEASAIESAVYGQEMIDWPTIEDNPTNEYKTTVWLLKLSTFLSQVRAINKSLCLF